MLTSAVVKIARVMRLPVGLELYRGLGGTLELPKSFFEADENGCEPLCDNQSDYDYDYDYDNEDSQQRAFFRSGGFARGERGAILGEGDIDIGRQKDVDCECVASLSIYQTAMLGT